MAKGDYEGAYQIYRKVLAISYQRVSLMGISIGLGVIANIFSAADRQEEAIDTWLLSYKVQRAMDNAEEYGVSELALGQAFRDRDKSLSVMWLMRARESLRGTKYKEDYVTLLIDLGNGLRSMGRNDEALAVRRDAWTLASSLGEKLEHRQARWGAALAYAENLQRHGRCEESLPVLDEALVELRAHEPDSIYLPNLLEWRADCLSPTRSAPGGARSVRSWLRPVRGEAW